MGDFSPKKWPWFSFRFLDQDTIHLIEIALFSRFLVFFIAVASDSVIPNPTNAPSLSNVYFPYVPLELFAKWDSFYYLQIAIQGYAIKQELWAFRPLYPLLMRAILIVSGYANWAIGGLIWNTLAFILAAVYLYRLTDLLMDRESAYTTVLLLSFLPAAVFFTALYPESTYLLLITASFYYLEKSQIIRAILLSTLAGFTRSEGFLTAIPFIWKALTVREKRVKLLTGSAMILLTFPAFMLYGYVVTGNAYISFEVFSKWGRTTLWTLMKYMEHQVRLSWPYLLFPP